MDLTAVVISLLEKWSDLTMNLTICPWCAEQAQIFDNKREYATWICGSYQKKHEKHQTTECRIKQLTNSQALIDIYCGAISAFHHPILS